MLDVISTGFTTLVGCVGDVIGAIFNTNGEFSALLPVVGISVGMTIVGFGIATVKNLIGRY